MSLPRSVSQIMSKHVTLEVEGIDRMYLNVYVPQLQRELGVVSFFRFHRGWTFASSALMEPISKAFITEVERFLKGDDDALISFQRDTGPHDLRFEASASARTL